jgi:hypothetical protein
MGHFKSRCPNPLVPEDDGGDFGGGGADGGFGDAQTDTGAGNGDADDWNTAAASTGGW